MMIFLFCTVVVLFIHAAITHIYIRELQQKHNDLCLHVEQRLSNLENKGE